MAEATASGGCLELIEAVEEGAESAKIAAVEGDAKASKRGEFGLIGFFGVGITHGNQGIVTEDIVKILVEADKCTSRDLAVQANDHDIADIAVGVEVVVEIDDFAAGEFEIVGDFKESEILFGNQAVAQ